MKSLLKTRTTLRITKKIYEEVTQEANNLGISVNAYIVMILSKELSAQIKKGSGQ